MIRVCLIGLPRQLRRRIEQSLEGRGISPSTIIADLDRTGKLQLKPKPELAISYLRDYYESAKQVIRMPRFMSYPMHLYLKM